MGKKILVYDPTVSDKLSSVRGIGRYLQILKENFSNEWIFSSNLPPTTYPLQSVFINPFFNFLQPPITFTKIAKKQIAVIHDLIPLKYPSHYPAGIKGSIYMLLNKLTLRNYDLIITDSEASKKDIINILRLPEGKIKVIYPCLPNIFMESSKWKIGIETSYENGNKKMENPASNIQPPNSLQDLPSKFCLYVGDATWNKNLVNLAKAIKIANVTCVFVGKIFSNVGVDPRIDPKQNKKDGHRDPPLQNIDHPWNLELKQFLELTKDDKRFVFPGFITDSELIKLYKQALLNILPSRDEGFGFSYVESAQFGCPSLLSGIPVLREISNGKAIFFDPKNPQDIAEKIKGFLSKNVGVDPRVDPNNKLINQAKKRSEFFSREKFKQEFLKLT